MTPVDASVRAARSADVPALLAMMRSFNREEGIPFRRQSMRAALCRLLRRPQLGVVVVARMGRGQRLVGYAVGTYGFDLEFSGRDAFVTELFVRPAARGRGHGALLLAGLTDCLRAGGAQALTLLVRPENRRARRLYRRAGFEELPRLAMGQRLAA